MRVSVTRHSRQRSVASTMHAVLVALLPGTACYVWWFGWGIVVQIGIAIVTALVCEAGVCLLRARHVRQTLGDLSAVVTAWLLALCIPSLAPWWLIVTGTAFAIVFAKHLYGGLGANIFNPAMVGYAVLLISFPVPMTSWPSPDASALSLFETMAAIGTQHAYPDSFTGATALDYAKTSVSLQHDLNTLHNEQIFGSFAAKGWEWIAAAYLLGGVWLLWRGTIRWHIPTAMLASLLGLALIFNFIDPARFASPLLHLFAGAALLGAFFIATDPVTAASSFRGRLLYGAGIGILTYVIRTWGGYPDGVAFAVLLMNLAVPAIDYFVVAEGAGARDEQ